MLDTGHDLHLGGRIAFQFVRDQNPWCITQAREKLTKEPFGGLAVAPALNKNIQRMAILVDSAPEIVVFAFDGEHDFVEMPFVAALRLTPAQFVGISLTELQSPLADRLICYENAATGHQFLNVAKTQRKSEVQPYDVADDVVWEAKAEVKLGGCHASSLQKLPCSAKLTVASEAGESCHYVISVR